MCGYLITRGRCLSPPSPARVVVTLMFYVVSFKWRPTFLYTVASALSIYGLLYQKSYRPTFFGKYIFFRGEGFYFGIPIEMDKERKTRLCPGHPTMTCFIFGRLLFSFFLAATPLLFLLLSLLFRSSFYLLVFPPLLWSSKVPAVFTRWLFGGLIFF